MLAALLFLTGCGNALESGETENEINEDPTPAVPAVGIGRAEEWLESDTESSGEGDVVALNGYTVCIDPGHGFLDGGCGYNYLPNGLVEKDVTLAIAKKVNEELKALGYRTVMTHDGKTFPKSARDDGNNKFNPNERVSYVNTLTLDYFVSIHVNAYEKDRSVSGARIYYQDTVRKINNSSGDVANCIAASIDELMPAEPTPYVISMDINDSFAVIRDTVAPASLVEVGFSTNEGDAAKMVTDEWQTEMAKSIALGIHRHFFETNSEA